MSNQKKEKLQEEISSEGTGSESESTSTKTFTPSGEQSNGSKKHWQRPNDVRGFASQANSVATMILNGEIDLEVARAYASVARVISQSISAETTRARFVKQEPDLKFDDEQ